MYLNKIPIFTDKSAGTTMVVPEPTVIDAKPVVDAEPSQQFMFAIGDIVMVTSTSQPDCRGEIVSINPPSSKPYLVCLMDAPSKPRLWFGESNLYTTIKIGGNEEKVADSTNIGVSLPLSLADKISETLQRLAEAQKRL